MSYFLNFRTQNVGGAVTDPYLLEGDGTATPPALSVVDWGRVPGLLNGRNLLFVAHGFNVSYQSGATSLGKLDGYLGLEPDLCIGVLWPGDCWLPVVDYPFEGSVAIDCGRRLAAFCNRWCATAQSLSFASHSLGARLVLEAVSGLERPARSVCLTAGAINRDCLAAEYAQATQNAERISILASREDEVLKLAFAIGDPFADLLHDDHAPFRAALGAIGPALPVAQPPVMPPWQIADSPAYGHGNYLPPDKLPQAGDPNPPLWNKVADFMRRSFLNQQQPWP